MKNAEDWWIEGRSKTRSETEVVELLKQIQIDALKEAAEIAMLYINADFQCAPSLIHDAILARMRELESSPEKEGR